MIINTDVYYCATCEELYFFETTKPYSKICPVCNKEMVYKYNVDCDTELAEKARNTPPYDPRKDPNSPYYIPVITCPYCKSTNTRKISGLSKAGSVGLWGIFGAGKVSKQWHCKQCGSDF